MINTFDTMKKIIHFYSFLFVILYTYDSKAQNSNILNQYTFKKGDYNGIGKWYMGREIAHVMGYQGIDWLQRSEREKEENVSKLIENLKINSSDIIADIGAGSGYHVFKMAPLAKNGFVYAVDIQVEMLMVIDKMKKSTKFKNVKTVLGTEKSIELPKNSIDKVLMVDVYHEFAFPVEMITSIKKAMKPDGELFLIEYRGEDSFVPIKKIHKMTQKQAVKEFEAAGLILKENIKNLPWQHCMIFVKKS